MQLCLREPVFRYPIRLPGSFCRLHQRVFLSGQQHMSEELKEPLILPWIPGSGVVLASVVEE
jgi:hypothetical protein